LALFQIANNIRQRSAASLAFAALQFFFADLGFGALPGGPVNDGNKVTHYMTRRIREGDSFRYV